jgi:large subunit ribosomal protein L21
MNIVKERVMYAILQSGGKQYKAEPGAVLKLEKLPGEVGEKVSLDQVLLVKDEDETQIGRPFLDDMQVHGRIVEQGRHRKIIVFKYKKRKDYHKKQGHRQPYTAVLVEGIGPEGTKIQLEKAPENVQIEEAPQDVQLEKAPEVQDSAEE